MVKNRKKCMPTLIYILIIMAICIFSRHTIGIARVCGCSMAPTLKEGSAVLVSYPKSMYKIGHSDIIIVQGQRTLVKRAIGIPGDTLQVKNGAVYLNGIHLEEKYISESYIDYAGIASEPLTLGAGEYFVMGDNRNHSLDSRYEAVGIIQEKDIKGKVIYIFY